ncbi:MAG: nucleotidyltransferase family protein [Dehalococcoidia bacterium]|nr:nucleotidyltransferase family protein [Dehalococcoidia bacterium]MSQ16388.1 nucleotidyltransferase family protein [Dehalococcoidia bacterium]
MSVAALLLAAGESRRMGRPKALLPWPFHYGEGTTLLAHQILALKAAGVDWVVVVLGHQAAALRAAVEPRLPGHLAGISWTVNPHYRQGKTTSVKAGLAALGSVPCDALLLLNVDQPRTAETLRHLLAEHRRGGSLITIPTYQGKGGHPVVLDGSLLEELREIDEATEGLRALVRRHRDGVRRVAVDAAEVLWDLNTPEEYQAAVQG